MNHTQEDQKQAVKTAAILRYGMTGTIAAAELVWRQKQNLAKAAAGFGFLLLLPVLFLSMLPSFIFGNLQMTDAWNDNAVLMQNIQRYQAAV